METEGSLPFPQELAPSPCPEPDESSPQIFTLRILSITFPYPLNSFSSIITVQFCDHMTSLTIELYTHSTLTFMSALYRSWQHGQEIASLQNKLSAQIVSMT